MKRCPECRRDYYDDTLLYCLDDGNALLEGPATASSGDEPATAILSVPPAIAGGLTGATDETDVKTAILQPPATAGGSNPVRGFDKRLILVPLALAVIVLGGFFGYRYITPAKQIESIAVMPFVNGSGNADVEYLSDGMTESLISSLSQVANLNVKARSSVFRYKGKETDVKTIGKELNVQAVLNGRVVQRGDQFTLSLELVEVQTENAIWSEQYNRKQSDLVHLQTEIARDVSNKLKSKLSSADVASVEKSHTANAEAYQLYLKGRFYWNKRTTPDIKRSIEYFNQAIAVDPAYALAYSGLADAWVVLPSFTNDPPPEEAYPRARAAAQKAIEIDPRLAEPHAALGVVLHEYDWKFAEAEQEFRRAIELNPNYASAHQWYGEYLYQMGKPHRAIEELRRAQELDPLSLIINAMLGYAYWASRSYDQATDEFHKSLELNPNFMTASAGLLQVYLAKGMYEEAIEQNRKLELGDEVPPEQVEKRAAEFKEAYRKFGARGFWQRSVEFAQSDAHASGGEIPPMYLAYLRVKMGDNEMALRSLERAFHSGKRYKGLISLKGNPDWDPLREEPRFQELLRRIGLPE